MSRIGIKVARIEVFEAINEPLLFRGRVWLSNTYNIYPSQLNTGDNGEDLHKMYSADVINSEITYHLLSASELIEGKRFISKDDFLNGILLQIEDYLSAIVD